MAIHESPPAGGTSIDPTALADPDAGWVSRRVYVDRDVYELELERVFARAWLYLCHVSQLREPGDYVTTFMGEDPVIVVRGADGQVRAFLNSCRHRGMRVCRADEGNTSFFRCPYHAWTYSNEGELRGVPKYRIAYEGVMDRKDWGLLPVAKLGEYHGLLFATWDPEAPELLDYLGGFTYYLDLIFGRDPKGIEIISGTHKWTIDGNWKHAAENFACDMYHVSSAHQRPAELGMMNPIEDDGYEVSAGAGYCGNQFARPVEQDFEGEETIHSFWTMPNPFTEPLKERRKAMAERLGPAVARLMPLGHVSVFPNFSVLDIENLLLVRVQQPSGPGRMLVHQWCCVDASLEDHEKQAMRRQYELAFGPAGLLEQDDGENWRSCQEGMSGYIGRHMETNMRLGLGQDRGAREVIGADVPGHGGGIWSEANQRHFYRHWLTYMGSEGSQELRARLAEVSYGEAVVLDLAARIELQFEVEQFLYHEAQLLDERRYNDWLALFSKAIEYRAPVRITREGTDDVADADGLHFFDDDYGQLELRVQGVQVKSAWAEIPPSRTRRIISNIRVEPIAGEDVRACSNFIVYRSRLESIEHLFVGSRTDVLRRLSDGRWQVRKRDIVFDNVAFLTDNISILF